MNLNAYVIREFLKEPVLWDSIREELIDMPYENADLYERGLLPEADTVYVISPGDFQRDWVTFTCGAYLVVGACQQNPSGFGFSVICL